MVTTKRASFFTGILCCPRPHPTMAKTSNKTAKPSAAKAKSGGKKEPSVKYRVLIALASQRAMGIEEVEKEKIFRLACVTNKHTFDTNCASMKKKELIECGEGGTLKLTQKGIAEVGEDAIAVPQTNDDMQAKLKEQIKVKKAHAIFDLLTDGKAYARSEIAEQLEMEENKTFKTYMSYLSKLVDKVDGKVRLKDIAFPVGRPCDK